MMTTSRQKKVILAGMNLLWHQILLSIFSQLNKNQLSSMGANILIECLTFAKNSSLKKLELLVCDDSFAFQIKSFMNALGILSARELLKM